MACRAMALAGCALALAVSGCGRREAAAPGTEGEAAGAEETFTRTEPLAAARAASIPEAAPQVPRLPHPSAARILDLTGAEALALGEAAELAVGADRFLQERIPDFAIKDDQRPWLDRQYVPQAWRIRHTREGWAAELELACHVWDEGQPAPGHPVILELFWNGHDWILTAAPDAFLRDLDHAQLTLAGDWAPGERMLAEP